MDLTIGSFDGPSRFRPNSHVSIETGLVAWLDRSHLPGRRSPIMCPSPTDG
jgi:hypothetical protein